MRKIFVSILFTITGIVVFGQIDIGADYYYIGEYNLAKKYLEEGLTKNPAMANFFLGEIAFKEGDMGKAESYYNNGLAAEPSNLFNQIGLAKLLLKKDAKSGESALFDIYRKNGKNIDVIVAIGRAYLDNGMLDGAEIKLREAAKVGNNKNAKVYILEGDIILAKNAKDLGNAAGKYEMAIYFDPNNCLTYFKLAAIYERIDPPSSIGNLEKVIEKCPNYMIAYRFLGKIYTQTGYYSDAIKAHQTYFNSEDQYVTIDDIEKYARAYFFLGDNEEKKENYEEARKNYEEAKALVDRGLKINPNHFILNRYLMYIFAQTEDFENGLKHVEKFFSLRPDVSGYISMDYTMYATILKELERYSEAIEQYNIAIQLDPENTELYEKAADMAKIKKDYGLAANYYKNLIAKKAEQGEKIDTEYKDKISDIYSLVYNYYSAGATILKNTQLAEELIKNEDIVNSIIAENTGVNSDSLKTDIPYFSKQYALYILNKADSAVDILIERTQSQNIYTGYRLKALIKYAINSDVEAGPAKPYYEKVVEIITAQYENQEEMSSTIKAILLEAYNYLGYHYYLIDDKPNIILYWNKVLEIDPENSNAISVLESMNKRK